MEHNGHNVATCRSHRDADAEFAASLPIAKFFTRARNRLRILMKDPMLSLQSEPHRGLRKTTRISVRSSGRHALPAAQGYNRPQAPHL